MRKKKNKNLLKIGVPPLQLAALLIFWNGSLQHCVE